MTTKSMRAYMAQKQREHRQRMKDLGLCAVTCYVHPEDRAAVHKFAELMCEKRGIYKSASADPMKAK